MTEDWQAIAAEVVEALTDVGFKTKIRRTTVTGKPWAAVDQGDVEYDIHVIDSRIKNFYAPGGLLVRRARIVLVGSEGVVPAQNDTVYLDGKWNVIQMVHKLSPAAVDVLYKLELAV